jgi:hypothetical protein
VDVAQFAVAVAGYATRFPCSATSWGRTPEHNARVGGVKHSAHLSWVGCDVIYPITPPVADAVAHARSLGLRLIREGDHDHLQPFDWPPG